jgi:hypothetical protein
MAMSKLLERGNLTLTFLHMWKVWEITLTHINSQIENHSGRRWVKLKGKEIFRFQNTIIVFWCCATWLLSNLFVLGISLFHFNNFLHWSLCEEFMWKSFYFELNWTRCFIFFTWKKSIFLLSQPHPWNFHNFPTQKLDYTT